MLTTENVQKYFQLISSPLCFPRLARQLESIFIEQIYILTLFRFPFIHLIVFIVLKVWLISTFNCKWLYTKTCNRYYLEKAVNINHTMTCYMWVYSTNSKR